MAKPSKRATKPARQLHRARVDAHGGVKTGVSDRDDQHRWLVSQETRGEIAAGTAARFAAKQNHKATAPRIPKDRGR